MRIKKIFALSMVAAMAFMAVGCGNSSETATVSDKENAGGDITTASDDAGGTASGTINITGSTSVEKVLNALKDEYMAQNPDVTINYNGTGSSAGIQDTINGINNLGASSRELTEEEKASDIKEETFAIDGIAVIANPENEVEDLSIQQLQDIYSGKITNWKDVGGKDAEIFVVSREESSGTRSGFEELVGIDADKGVALTKKANVSEGNGNVQLTVAQNENAIGYVSFAFINETVKGLKVEGIEANDDNISNDSYQLKRPFLLVYKDEAALTETGKKFLEFIKSDEGQQIVEDSGEIRITK